MSKTILITGASGGIGNATAKFFQKKGWNVIATMRSPKKETELNQLDNVLVTRLDVVDIDSIENAIQEGVNRFGGIDAVLNNAGFGAYGPLEAFSRETIINQFNTNVIGLIDVTRAILPHFRSNKSGTLINISSMGGKIGIPLGAIYHGTKYAVEGVSEALSFEMQQIGAKVKIIEPGMIATNFVSNSTSPQKEEEITEYAEIVEKLKNIQSASASYASPVNLVVETIYQAATDDSSQLRYVVGQDAEMILDNRKKMSDDEFMAMIKGQFQL